VNKTFVGVFLRGHPFFTLFNFGRYLEQNEGWPGTATPTNKFSHSLYRCRFLGQYYPTRFIRQRLGYVL